MTPHVKHSKVFLNFGEFPERGTGRPVAVAIAELTISLSCTSCHYFHNGPSFRRVPTLWVSTTPEELPSLQEGGQAPSSFHRFRRSFRHGLIDWRYYPDALGLTVDDAGLSPVNVVSHFVQATPPVTLMIHAP